MDNQQGGATAEQIGAVRQLMRLSARQGGWLTAADMRSAGLRRGERERLIRSGVLLRGERDLFRLAGVPQSWEDHLRAMLRSLAGTASHETAARVWGFEGFPRRPLHVTVDRTSRGVEAPDVVVHTSQRSLTADTAVMNGIRTTMPLRTLVELAGTAVDDEALGRLLEHLVAERRVPLDRLKALLESNPRRLSSRRLSTILDGFAGGPVDSKAEAELLRLLASHDLPVPVTQYTIRAKGQFVARVDFAWPEVLVALELDGYLHHTDESTFVADRDRGNKIIAAGWKLLRTTPAQVRGDARGLLSELAVVLQTAPCTKRDADAASMSRPVSL